MIEDKDTIDYLLTITTGVKCHCSKIDPIGMCTPEDCLTCENAKVKIVRVEDGCVMRKE